MATERAPRHVPSQREAHEAAIVALAGQGLEMDPFGIAVAECIIAGEVTEDEATALLVERYRETPPQ
ncbi:MAG: antitoxin VbhA family protein [Candidatus Eremiobacteraeota bacterium]|nr:antitoxin VbhA family protein [Candidatus Eremiobacteraeota bacterium]